jgi:glycosyltransferase involved in cell wall biosynthesis
MSKIFVVGARGIPDVEGGVEKNTERLFPLIVQQGWEVVLVGLEEHIKSSSYKGVRLLPARSSKILKTDKIIYYLDAVRLAFTERPEIVHMQGLGAAIMLWAYKLMGKKTVVRYGLADYVLPKWGLLGRWGFLLSEYQLRFADAVIAVTPALAERLRRRGIERNVHVIGNAIDSRDAYSSDASVPVPDRPYVLAVGRVTVQKNLHRLVEGFKIFRRAYPDAMLILAGGLDDTDYVRELSPLLDEHVQLLGKLPRSSLGPLYANAQVYVNSSVHEGSSNAVLEAVSWGAPILLSDIPENRDFGIADRHFFDPERPEAIAAALERAFSDRSAYVPDESRFLTWREVADRTAAIYRSFGLAERKEAAHGG